MWPRVVWYTFTDISEGDVLSSNRGEQYPQQRGTGEREARERERERESYLEKFASEFSS
jgi:hypothetical protein